MNTHIAITLGAGNGSLGTSAQQLLDRLDITFDPRARAAWQHPENATVKAIFQSRPQHLVTALRTRLIDCAIVGADMLAEFQRSPDEFVALATLSFSKTTLNTHTRVIAFVNECAPHQTIADLEGKAIISEFPAVTRRWLANAGVTADITPSSGSTESVVTAGLYTCGIGITETGSTIDANNLRILATLMDAPVIVAARAENADDAALQAFGHALRNAHHACKTSTNMVMAI